MKKILLFLVSIISLNALSQNQPVFRNWYAVQGIYNPAMAGSYGLRDMTFIHRRQWTGTDAGPVAAGFYFQHAGRHRLSYGISATMNEAVRLRNTDSRFMLAYHIPLTKQLNLRFGLSAGLATRKLNLRDDDFSNDPAVLRAADGIYGLAGAFGLALEGERLQLGVSLPAVLPQESYSPAQLAAIGNSQLLSQWYSIRYRFRSATRKFEADPWLVYRVLRDLRRNAEGGILFSYDDAVSLGFGYNQTLGPSLTTGFRLTDGVRIGWTWEPGMGKENTFGATHEFRLSIKVGREHKSPTLQP